MTTQTSARRRGGDPTHAICYNSSCSRAGVTQLAECLLPKSEPPSAMAPLVATPPFRPSYTLLFVAIGGLAPDECGSPTATSLERNVGV